MTLEGDCAIIRQKGQAIALTAPLHVKGYTNTRAGQVEHDNIIGKQPRDVITSSEKKDLRVNISSLEEYVVMTPRFVIYPPDANLIISLLDLHPDGFQSAPCGNPRTQPLEILEAGTGHGALTLYLARAIHAANSGLESAMSDDGQTSTSARNPKRRAIVHTVDESPKYSKHAVRIVSGFRKGMYMRDIDFHVGDISIWIDQQMATRDLRPFLSHVLLDLPSSYTHVEKATSALHVDGKLVLFNPSITQINAAIEYVKAQRLPLQLERVVEVGPAMTGGRIWDVRLVKPRASAREGNDRNMSTTKTDEDQPASEELDEKGSSDGDEGWQMVCKPKIGERISGGGFVGLWSKNRTRKDYQ
ncbi:MAG: hypothetical protein Q9216_000621 [Gyalolechia sp. 2 TL-2023]